MGVPGLLKYIKKRYIDLKTIKKDKNIKTITRQNIYIDMNSVIHDISQKIFKYGKHKHEQDEYRDISYKNRITILDNEILLYIDIIINVLLPDTLMISFDGPPPIGKIKQQRSRRFKISDNINIEEFNNNIISTGTEYMEKLSNKIKKYIDKNIKMYKNKKKIKNIIYSSHRVRGEGEHKIMNYIRKNENNKNNIIIGKDGDLILLGMLTNDKKNVYIMREKDILVNELRDINNNYYNLIKNYDILNCNNIKKKINIDMNSNDIMNFIILTFFIGNDFIPKIPEINIYNSTEYLIKIYKLYTKNISKYIDDDNNDLFIYDNYYKGYVINIKNFYFYIYYLYKFENIFYNLEINKIKSILNNNDDNYVVNDNLLKSVIINSDKSQENIIIDTHLYENYYYSHIFNNNFGNFNNFHIVDFFNNVDFSNDKNINIISPTNNDNINNHVIDIMDYMKYINYPLNYKGDILYDDYISAAALNNNIYNHGDNVFYDNEYHKSPNKLDNSLNVKLKTLGEKEKYNTVDNDKSNNDVDYIKNKKFSNILNLYNNINTNNIIFKSNLNILEMCFYWLKTLNWNLLYYTGGLFDKTYQYKFNYSPMIRNIFSFLYMYINHNHPTLQRNNLYQSNIYRVIPTSDNIIQYSYVVIFSHNTLYFYDDHILKFDIISDFLTPIQCLVSILPIKDFDFIPDDYKNIIYNNMIHYYPLYYTIDYFGKYYFNYTTINHIPNNLLHYGISILPNIDYNVVKNNIINVDYNYYNKFDEDIVY